VDFHLPFTQAWFDHPTEYNLALHWGGGWEGGWGKHGDGRCHLVTRENMDGVWMQNWHFGPMGFQMLTDTAMQTYLTALEGVMRDDTKPEDWSTASLPPPAAIEGNFGNARYAHISGNDLRLACLTGYGPQFTALADMKQWHLPIGAEGNPFPATNNPAGDERESEQWQWTNCKHSSHGHAFQWSAPNSVVRQQDCESFPDVGYMFTMVDSRKAANGAYSQWLTFKVPAPPSAWRAPSAWTF